jgi:hypothetical protein
MRRGASLLALAGLVVAAACSAPDPSARFVAQVPDRASFPPVADLLDRRCGTLDCHGTTARNLRLYGHEGLRLDPASRPSSKPNTTEAEYDEDFLSVVGLEPELVSAVVASGGQGPDRLSLVRKARGTEHHKGGTIWNAGEPGDRCLTSWLAGQTDAAACQSSEALRPAGGT